MTETMSNHFTTKVTSGKYGNNLKSVRVEVRHPKHGRVGCLSAVIVNASSYPGEFFEIMNHTAELYDFACALFDDTEHVNPMHLQGDFQNGLGLWGNELNEGSLILILHVDVNQPFRRKGIGASMIMHIQSFEGVTEKDFLVSWPAPNRHSHPEAYDESGDKSMRRQAYKNAQVQQIRFFRKNGFRRIGRTKYFAYPLNPAHISHSISPENDLDFANPADEFPRRDSDSGAQLRCKAFPMHYAISRDNSEAIITTIREAYENDPNSIHSQDDVGQTPVHVAASSFNLPAVRTLLGMGVPDELRSRHTSKGMTPLEDCERSLLSERQIRNIFSSRPPSDADGEVQKIKLRCVAALKCAMELPEMNQITDEGYAEQRKWGCTCGSCAGGFLSLRMRFRLEDIADGAAEALKDTYEDFQLDQPLQKTEWGLCSELEFLPTKLHHSVTKTFCEGYSTTFSTISCILKHLPPDHLFIPFPSDVIDIMASPGCSHAIRGHEGPSTSLATQHFLSNGGLPDYALDYTLHRAMECSLSGEETWDDLLGDESDAEISQRYRGLPICSNDLNFELVRTRLGLVEDARGPHVRHSY